MAVGEFSHGNRMSDGVCRSVDHRDCPQQRSVILVLVADIDILALWGYGDAGGRISHRNRKSNGVSRRA
jgi:hypothetical protein